MYYTLECGKCHAPRFLITPVKRGTQPDRLLPPATKYDVPNWIASAPAVIREMTIQVFAALNAGHFWLCVLGIRTLIDAFALEKVGDVGGFKAKLERLQKEGYLSSKDVLTLSVAVELGHDATHRAVLPTEDSCLPALTIVLHLLQRFSIEKEASVLQILRSGDQASGA